MPNIYASLSELRNGIPGALIEPARTRNSYLLRVAEDVSRLIDEYCDRVFYPSQRTIVLDGCGGTVQRIPEMISLTTVEYSRDNGQTYSVLSSSDYLLADSRDYDPIGSFDRLILNVNGTTLSTWPTGQRSLRLTGLFGFTDDRARAWLSSGDSSQNAPNLSTTATTLMLNDVDALDVYGIERRVPQGALIRLQDEIMETTQTVDDVANTIGIVRGVNGTTAATHPQGTAVQVWRLPSVVRRATVVQTVRHMMRALQGFGDARATPEVGELFLVKQLDPEVRMMLDTMRRMVA